jgi:hypothetical protein
MREIYTVAPTFSMPTFTDGVAFVRLPTEDCYFGIFFECEPDAFYFFEPSADTLLRLKHG